MHRILMPLKREIILRVLLNIFSFQKENRLDMRFMDRINAIITYMLSSPYTNARLQ